MLTHLLLFSLPAYAPVVTIRMSFCQIFHEVYKFYALFLHSFGVLSSKYSLQCFVLCSMVGIFIVY